jgi:hypothetical protein
MIARQFTISELRAAIEGLRKATPVSDRLPMPPDQESNKAQWLRWLEEYLEPGFYNRQTFVDDARHVYQHLSNARMIVWLNEAAGEDGRLIEAAIVAAQERVNNQAEARYARLVLPWERVAQLLFADQAA